VGTLTKVAYHSASEAGIGSWSKISVWFLVVFALNKSSVLRPCIVSMNYSVHTGVCHCKTNMASRNWDGIWLTESPLEHPHLFWGRKNVSTKYEYWKF
jgi:hypothetical protein